MTTGEWIALSLGALAVLIAFAEYIARHYTRPCAAAADYEDDDEDGLVGEPLLLGSDSGQTKTFVDAETAELLVELNELRLARYKLSLKSEIDDLKRQLEVRSR